MDKRKSKRRRSTIGRPSCIGSQPTASGIADTSCLDSRENGVNFNESLTSSQMKHSASQISSIQCPSNFKCSGVEIAFQRSNGKYTEFAENYDVAVDGQSLSFSRQTKKADLPITISNSIFTIKAVVKPPLIRISTFLIGGGPHRSTISNTSIHCFGMRFPYDRQCVQFAECLQNAFDTVIARRDSQCETSSHQSGPSLLMNSQTSFSTSTMPRFPAMQKRATQEETQASSQTISLPSERARHQPRLLSDRNDDGQLVPNFGYDQPNNNAVPDMSDPSVRGQVRNLIRDYLFNPEFRQFVCGVEELFQEVVTTVPHSVKCSPEFLDGVVTYVLPTSSTMV